MTAVLVKQPSEGLGIKSKRPCLGDCLLHGLLVVASASRAIWASPGRNGQEWLKQPYPPRRGHPGQRSDYTFPRSGRILF